MKLERHNIKTMQAETLADDVRNFTVHTSAGSFTIAEDESGALHIHESSHLRLAVHPRQANAIVLQAVDPL